MSAQDIESEFQKLRSVHYQITSQDTTDYNCFAWAMHDQNDWYSPAPMAGYYWPPNLQRNTTVATFIELYRQEGQFLPCDDGELEDGFEKIALYVNENGNVTHAARQKPSGVWTSKLGSKEDIEHPGLTELEDAGVRDDDYGKATQFLKRPRS